MGCTETVAPRRPGPGSALVRRSALRASHPHVCRLGAASAVQLAHVANGREDFMRAELVAGR
jgi:hypothetical protein